MLDFKDIEVALPEIRAARDETKKRLAAYGDQLESFYGEYFMGTRGPEDDGAADAPENVYFEMHALLSPRMAFTNPRVRVKSNRIGPFGMIAKGMQHATNRWAKDVHYERVMQESCADFLFNVSVLRLSMVENPLLGGDNDELNPMWPEVNRISQKRHFCDPLAETAWLKRFEGNDTFLDKDDLLDIARRENADDSDREEWNGYWYIDEIEGLQDTAVPDEDRRKGTPNRKQVLLTEVWVKGYTEEGWPGRKEGYHGAMFTYGGTLDSDEGGLVLIKDPEPFYGPPWGPYYSETGYIVPDQPVGISALTANEGVIRQMNRLSAAVDRSTETYKNGLFVDDVDPNLADRIEMAEHQSVFAVAGIKRDMVVPWSVGGASQEQLLYRNDKRASVDRLLGISESMRGVASADATATAENLAAQGGNVRIAWLQGRFFGLHQRVLTGASWYMYHSERFRISLDEAAAKDMGAPTDQPLVFQGGPMEKDFPDQEATFADTELTLDLMSAQHVSEAVLMQRAQIVSQYLAGKAQTAPMAPFVNHQEEIRMFGEALGMPEIESLWNQPMYELYTSVMLQGQMNTKQPEPQPDPHPNPQTAAPAQRLPRPPDSAQTVTGGVEALPGQSAGQRSLAASSGPM
jgi:hypothetical protein